MKQTAKSMWKFFQKHSTNDCCFHYDS